MKLIKKPNLNQIKKGKEIMVDVTLSGSPREFSVELKNQLSKNCLDIFRYIFDEIIPNIKNLVEIEFDYRDMGDKKDYFRRYGDCFRMTLYPKSKCRGRNENDYFELRPSGYGSQCYEYSIFKKLNTKIGKEWFEWGKEYYKNRFEDDFCADFFKEYGMQLQLMCHWPTVKKQLLAAIEADKKLTEDVQNSIKSFKI